MKKKKAYLTPQSYIEGTALPLERMLQASVNIQGSNENDNMFGSSAPGSSAKLRNNMYEKYEED